LASDEESNRTFPVRKTSICLTLATLVFVAIGSRSSASPTPDLQATARAVDEHYNRLKTLQAEFTEIYSGAGVERTESGTLWLKKPGKMRWEYRSPRDKLFLSDGQNAWFYLPGDKQVRKTPMKKLEDLRSPLGLLLGKTHLEKELHAFGFAPDIPPMVDGDVVLRGVPNGIEDRVSEVQLEISPENHIRRIRIIGVDGSTTEYRFTEQKEGVPIDDARFHFSPPAGVETIDGEPGQ
jgi:outer membrane lipoprotein carrier protein